MHVHMESHISNMKLKYFCVILSRTDLGNGLNQYNRILMKQSLRSWGTIPTIKHKLELFEAKYGTYSVIHV